MTSELHVERDVTADALAPSRLDTTTDDALGTSDMTDLLQRLRGGEVSGAQLRIAASARLEAATALNAITGEIKQTHRQVAADGPFAGVPTVMKDNEPIEGIPTTSCSRAVPDRPAVRSAPFTRMYLGLGLDPIATSTLPEFGLTASTESLRFGATHNPWDLSRSAGGSSGGSAALVAAGVVPIAHANDGGGSIRIPASCCGVVGLKPSRGRLPNDPEVERLPVRIIAQGVITRTVRDTALFLTEAERVAPAEHLAPIGSIHEPSPRRLRIGVCTTSVNDLPWDDDVLDAVRTTADVLDGLGHHVAPTGPPVDDRFGPDFLTLWALMAFSLHRGGRYAIGSGWDSSKVEPLMRGLSGRLVRFGERLPGALRRLRRLANDGEPTWREHDILVTPVTGHPAPPLGYLGPDVDVREHLVRLLRFCSVTSVQNVSGSPAISLPLGRTRSGLPIGVQLAAPLGQERRLLEIALELEAARPWPLTPGALG